MSSNPFRNPLDWFRTDQTDWVATRPAEWLTYWIALAAGVGLFLQLAMIRWHGSVFPIFGFYKNFSMLSALLGLGMGYALGKRRAIRLGYVVLFQCLQLALFATIKVMGWHHFLGNPVGEFVTSGLAATHGVENWLGVVAFLAIVYALNALTFLPLGQVASALMSRVPILKGYGFYLLGSVGGVVLFTALSYLWMPPEVWFALGLAGLLCMMGTSALAPPIVVFSLLFTTFSTYEPRPLRKNLYSPYQALSVRPVNDESRITLWANRIYDQKILDLSHRQALRSPSAQLNSMPYDMPFQLCGHPDNILVIGAGMGNDVAAALRRGAVHVDAVEIDPLVQKAGADLHPERPYLDPRVSVHIGDSRVFLRKAAEPYDLIVYSSLDSHATASNLSPIRLDSFVYTVEAFREARGKLKPGGMLALSFTTILDPLGRKIFRMLKQAFDGAQPIVLQSGYEGGVLFLAGGGTRQAVSGSLPLPNLASYYAGGQSEVDVATDDWPFFNMPARIYPVSLAAIVVVLLLLSTLMIRGIVPTERRAGFKEYAWLFFFLGAGFLLLETRATTEFGLVFGNTWGVFSAAAAGIFAVAWLANLTAISLPRVPAGAAFVGLALSGFLGWWLGGQPSMALAPWLKTMVAVLPLLFAGLLYSSLLRSHASISQAMAASFFGAVFGGMLEFHCAVTGFRSLYLLGLAFYAAAFGVYRMQRRALSTSGRGFGKVPLRKVASNG